MTERDLTRAVAGRVHSSEARVREWMTADPKVVSESTDPVEAVQIMLDGEELLALDDFRFKQRMPSRAAAVRELLKRGLAAEGFLSATAGTKSSEYGVIGKTPAGRQ